MILGMTMVLWGQLILALTAPAVAENSETVFEHIQVKASEIKEELIEVRRQIHMYPEVSGQEEKTAALVAERLRGLGIEVETGVGGHGVVGVLRGARSGPVVAFRVDMDAVRSPVVGDPPYKSRVPGVKHVCGHDAHVAVGLGVAEILASLLEKLPGTVKFLFQPAEENVQGARAMIEDGALENPTPEVIFSVHTVPLPVGFIGVPPGVGLTGWDPFRVVIEGKVKKLETTADEVRDALVALSTVPTMLNPASMATLFEAMTQESGPFEDFLLVTGVRKTKQEGRIVLQGLLRAAGPEIYERGRQLIRDTIETTAGKTRASVEFGEHFPDMHSDPDLVNAAIGPIEAAIGEGKTILIRASAPYFGEDFALFQEQIPGAMFFLGVANPERGITAFNHSPDYDIDEGALEVGAAAMSSVLFDYLSKP